jgi:hypothetical protein
MFHPTSHEEDREAHDPLGPSSSPSFSNDEAYSGMEGEVDVSPHNHLKS